MEKMFPKLPVTQGAGSHGIASTKGAIETAKPDMAAELVDVSVAKTQPAPANPDHTWTAGG